jgi:hypothetical protein
MSQPTYYYVWTAAMQDRLLALLKQGMPYKEIAASFPRKRRQGHQELMHRQGQANACATQAAR